jgi:hypothetical protein
MLTDVHSLRVSGYTVLLSLIPGVCFYIRDKTLSEIYGKHIKLSRLDG